MYRILPEVTVASIATSSRAPFSLQEQRDVVVPEGVTVVVDDAMPAAGEEVPVVVVGGGGGDIDAPGTPLTRLHPHQRSSSLPSMALCLSNSLLFHTPMATFFYLIVPVSSLALPPGCLPVCFSSHTFSLFGFYFYSYTSLSFRFLLRNHWACFSPHTSISRFFGFSHFLL